MHCFCCLFCYSLPRYRIVTRSIRIETRNIHTYLISSVLYKHVNHFLFDKYLFFNTSSWCAAPTSDLRSQHLQVDLLTIHHVSAVSTQGAVTQNSWVSSYLVHYSLDGNEWIVPTDEEGEIKVCFSTVHIVQKLY